MPTETYGLGLAIVLAIMLGKVAELVLAKVINGRRNDNAVQHGLFQGTTLEQHRQMITQLESLAFSVGRIADITKDMKDRYCPYGEKIEELSGRKNG